MTETSLRELKKQRTRARLLEVALEIFHRDGFAATRLSDVARQAELSDQTLFNYFTTKEALFEAAVVDWLRERSPLMNPKLSVEKMNLEDAFTPPLNKWLAFIDENRWMLGIAAAHTDLLVPYRRNRPIVEVNYAVRRQRVEALQRLGRVRDDISAEQLCILYQAIRDHVVGQWLLDTEKPISALRREYRTNMAVFMAGIARSD